MKRLTLFITAFLFIFTGVSFGQYYGGAVSESGPTVPSTCSDIGTFFWDTVNDQLYVCDPADTFTVVGSTTISNINQISIRPITSLTSGTYKLFYSSGSGAPLELALGTQYYLLHSNGPSGTPYFGPVTSNDIVPYSLDADIFVGDSTNDGKIPASVLNIQSMDITAVDSIVWTAGGMTSDGTNCADPTQVQINSGPDIYTIICADNDASYMYGFVTMPDGWLAFDSQHTGSNNASILTDSTQSWVPDSLIGLTVFNATDGSSCEITDNDATTVTCTLSGGTEDDWDTNDYYNIGEVTFELTILQTAADTGAFNADIEMQCKASGSTFSSTWAAGPNAMDLANVGGSNKVDFVQQTGTMYAYGGPGRACAWRLSIDSGGTTTAMATLHILAMKMEFRKLIGD